MLFIKRCNCISKKLMWSLQARTDAFLRRRKRASRLASFLQVRPSGTQRGSITVEAALVFPIFLAAVCCFVGLGQLLLVEAEVQYSVSQTAKVCAKQRALAELDEEASGKGGAASGDAAAVFRQQFAANAVCANLIAGGRRGIRVTLEQPGEGRVRVRARYTLKLLLPFFPQFSFAREARVTRQIYVGYVERGGDGASDSGGGIVYVAQNGSVYHTSPTCTHICLSISGAAAVQRTMREGHYEACEKCIETGENYSALYVTASGDCYHATLGCSGLKRTIHAVKKSELSGLKLCSRCAGR